MSVQIKKTTLAISFLFFLFHIVLIHGLWLMIHTGRDRYILLGNYLFSRCIQIIINVYSSFKSYAIHNSTNCFSWTSCSLKDSCLIRLLSLPTSFLSAVMLIYRTTTILPIMHIAYISNGSLCGNSSSSSSSYNSSSKEIKLNGLRWTFA